MFDLNRNWIYFSCDNKYIAYYNTIDSHFYDIFGEVTINNVGECIYNLLISEDEANNIMGQELCKNYIIDNYVLVKNDGFEEHKTWYWRVIKKN